MRFRANSDRAGAGCRGDRSSSENGGGVWCASAGRGRGTPGDACTPSPRSRAPGAAATASVPRRYALPWFKALFATGVGRAPASNDMEQRLENLNVFFTYFVYTNVLTRRHMHFDFST